MSARVRARACFSSQNIDEVRAEFTRQSGNFENEWTTRSKRNTSDIMKWVMASVEQVYSHAVALGGVGEGVGVKALDVACGTGIFARALAKLPGVVVTGVDATKAMLEEAAVNTTKEGQTITFECGDATNMSQFEENSFDIVTSRLAIHHFSNPEDVVKEMTRVCRVGGHVVIVDIVALDSDDDDDDDDSLQLEMNRLERLRDPSHTTALTAAQLISLLQTASGGKLDVTVNGNDFVNATEGQLDVTTDTHTHTSTAAGVVRIPYLENGMNLSEWMNSTNTIPSARVVIERSMDIELGGGTGTGMRAYRDENNEVCFKHRYVIAIGQKLN